jgi:mRNA interferase RelE/StbE
VPYRVEFTTAALRDLQALPREIQLRIDASILAVADTPRHPGAERLQGGSGLFRVRVGAYRMIYHIDDAQQVVTIARVRHRRDVYRGL